MNVGPMTLSPRIERQELWHFLGYPADREPPPRVVLLAAEMLAEARTLTAARGAFVMLPIERAAEVGLEPIEAEELVIGLVSAGGAIEERVRQLLEMGQMTRALLLDAAGSAAAEEAADLLGAQIVGEERGRAEAPSCRLSPGYGRWPLSAQTAIFALLPHAELGVRLLPSMLMVPRKSISFALWLGATGPIGTGLSGCSRCNLERCRYRRTPPCAHHAYPGASP